MRPWVPAGAPVPSSVTRGRGSGPRLRVPLDEDRIDDVGGSWLAIASTTGPLPIANRMKSTGRGGVRGRDRLAQAARTGTWVPGRSAVVVTTKTCSPRPGAGATPRTRGGLAEVASDRTARTLMSATTLARPRGRDIDTIDGSLRHRAAWRGEVDGAGSLGIDQAADERLASPGARRSSRWFRRWGHNKAHVAERRGLRYPLPA